MFFGAMMITFDMATLSPIHTAAVNHAGVRGPVATVRSQRFSRVRSLVLEKNLLGTNPVDCQMVQEQSGSRLEALF